MVDNQNEKYSKIQIMISSLQENERAIRSAIFISSKVQFRSDTYLGKIFIDIVQDPYVF